MFPRFNRVFYGWWIVAIAMVVNAIVTGVFWWGIAVFFLPISRDLGISRAATALPVSLSRFVGGFQGPFVGVMVDRVGPSKVLFTAALIGGLGFLLLSRTNSYTMYMVVFIAVLGLGMQSGFDAPTMATVSQWFVRKRGVAMSLTAIGFAFGGAVITPLVAVAVNAFGWRDTTLVIGILIWVVILPLSTRLYRSPESRGLLPDGAPAPPPVKSGPQSRSTSRSLAQDFTVREAMSTRAYWHLSLSMALRSVIWGALIVHMVAIMEWKGIDESTAGLMVGLMAFIGMPAALIMGWLGDRYPKQNLVSVGDWFTAAALVLLATIDQLTPWQMILIFILWAPNQGNWPLSWAILAERFGRRNFASLRGGIVATMSFLSFGAPLYSGWVFDTTDSYYWAIAPGAVLLGTSSLLSWFMPKTDERAPPGIQPI